MRQRSALRPAVAGAKNPQTLPLKARVHCSPFWIFLGKKSVSFTLFPMLLLHLRGAPLLGFLFVVFFFFFWLKNMLRSLMLPAANQQQRQTCTLFARSRPRHSDSGHGPVSFSRNHFIPAQTCFCRGCFCHVSASGA